MLIALPARAQVALPGSVSAALAQPRLAGVASYTFWGFDIYQARLWVEPGFDSAALSRQRFALELGYRRSFKGSDIAQRSIDEMRRIGTFTPEQAQRWLQAMQVAFPNVAAGDHLLGVNLPGRGAQFFANGRATAEVADPVFAELFFGIWLSERSSEPQLRTTLLGAVPARP